MLKRLMHIHTHIKYAHTPTVRADALLVLLQIKSGLIKLITLGN